MPKSGTLTKAHIVEVVVEHEREGNTEEVKFQFNWER